MKLPRNLSADQLIRALKKLDYQVIRQKGSHIRLSTNRNGVHHITIPNHNPINIGTLSAILNDIANHLSMDKDKLLEELFG